MSLLPSAAHFYLNKMVDYDQGMVHKDLYQIAHNMLYWDSPAPQLGLNEVDVADIKHDHRTAEQQRLDVKHYSDIFCESLLISVLNYSLLIELQHFFYGSRELLVHIMTS